MLLRTILHPTDFSPPSMLALKYALDLARRQGARLLVVHVGATSPAERDELDRLASDPGAVPLEYFVSDDDPAHAIVKVARERGCDLIVMGSYGRTGLRRLFARNAAQMVVRKAPCPVLIIKTGLTEPSQERGRSIDMHPYSLSEKGA